MQKTQDDAEKVLKKWQDDISERELAEKRRVAPGWLDREEKILEPEKKGEGARVTQANIMDMQEDGPAVRSLADERSAAGEELDRAFGGMNIR